MMISCNKGRCLLAGMPVPSTVIAGAGNTDTGAPYSPWDRPCWIHHSYGFDYSHLPLAAKRGRAALKGSARKPCCQRRTPRECCLDASSEQLKANVATRLRMEWHANGPVAQSTITGGDGTTAIASVWAAKVPMSSNVFPKQHIGNSFMPSCHGYAAKAHV